MYILPYMDLTIALAVFFLSLLAHLIITGFSLALTLWYARKEAQKTLKIAMSIEARIKEQIDKMNKEATIEDNMYAMLNEYATKMVQIMDGKVGDLTKKVDAKIDEAVKKAESGKRGPGGDLIGGLLAGALG